jgi:multidrug efflux pump subunit AcrA (membrane-fusion protein)
MQSKKRWLWPVAAASAALILAWAFHFLHSGQTARPKTGTVVESVYGIGTVTARHTYQLKLGISDTLRKLFVQEGDRVPRNAPLVALTDHGTVRAPFAGVLTSLPYKEGETLFPELPVLTLTDLRNPYVVVSLEQSGIIPVRRGQEAFLSFESLRGSRWEGRVASVYPRDGEFYVNIEAPDLPSGVLVGMTCDVAIQVASKENVLQVPVAALDKGWVTLRRGGKTRKVELQTGITDGAWVEVTGGDLKADDLLLLPGR